MDTDPASGPWHSAFDIGDSPQTPIMAAPPIIGTPDLDATEWDGQQSFPDDCALRCQQFIIEQYTGVKIDENALVLDAEAHGWYDPGSGTPPEDAGKELAVHGIPVQEYEHANIYDLAAELAQGHRVIIGVDSSELWNDSPTGQADHAVVVSGIDTSDPEHPQVIVSDPGLPGWHAEDHYPLDQFLQAWKASDFFMVATQEPAPPQTPGMENFAYSAGHIDNVAGIPYDQFAALSVHPGAFESLLDDAQSAGTALTPEAILDHAQQTDATLAGHDDLAHTAVDLESVHGHHPDEHPYATIDAFLHGDLHAFDHWSG